MAGIAVGFATARHRWLQPADVPSPLRRCCWRHNTSPLIATTENSVFSPVDRHPLLVVGEHGDADERLRWRQTSLHIGSARWSIGACHESQAQAPQANGVEVGGDYATFLRQLLSWVGQL